MGYVAVGVAISEKVCAQVFRRSSAVCGIGGRASTAADRCSIASVVPPTTARLGGQCSRLTNPPRYPVEKARAWLMDLHDLARGPVRRGARRAASRRLALLLPAGVAGPPPFAYRG